MNRARLFCFFAAACLSCGARTPLADDPLATTDAGPRPDASAATVTLSIPLGAYSDCMSSTVTLRPRFVGATGRAGSLTLAQQGDGVVATLAFPTYANGSLVFIPTTGSSAAFGANQSFNVQTANADFSVVPVTATTGALSLVGQTLFLSTRGFNGSDDVSTFFHCRVPAGIPSTAVVARASPPGRLTAGVYQSCTATSGTDGPFQSNLSGGSGPVTITEAAGTFHLTWPDSALPGLTCSGFDFGAAPVNAALTAGQSCVMHDPCGPPPTFGTSPYPSMATLSNMRGSMMVNGNALFIDLLGDAGAMACGLHDVLITCANP